MNIKKKSPAIFLRKVLSSLILGAFLVFLVSGCGGSSEKNIPQSAAQLSPDELKKHQEIFTEWNKALTSDLKQFDTVWSEWKKTFDGMANGQISRHEAYSNFKNISVQMNSLSTKFFKIKPPSNLSKEDQKLLEEATSNFSNMASARQSAAEKMMKMIDENDYKPSRTNEIVDVIKGSEGNMIRGVAGIIGVQKNLHLVDSQK